MWLGLQRKSLLSLLTMGMFLVMVLVATLPPTAPPQPCFLPSRESRGIQVQRSKTRELHMLREEMLTCLVRVCARPVLPVMMHPGLFSVSFAPPSLLCIRVVCVLT